MASVYSLDHQLPFSHRRKFIKRREAVKRSLDADVTMLWNLMRRRGRPEKSLEGDFLAFLPTAFRCCRRDNKRLIQHITRKERLKNMNSILIAMLSDLSKSKDSFLYISAWRAETTPNIDTNFTSLYNALILSCGWNFCFFFSSFTIRATASFHISSLQSVLIFSITY